MKQKEGYASTSNNRTIVVLDTELTEEFLLKHGFYCFPLKAEWRRG